MHNTGAVVGQSAVFIGYDLHSYVETKLQPTVDELRGLHD
jgi:hypothetical protein